MADGLMARCGRWCFRRRWWVLLLWILVATAGAAATTQITSHLADDSNPRHIESVEAYSVLSAGNNTGGTIVGLVDRVDPTSPAVRDTVTRVSTELAAMKDVKRVDNPYSGDPRAAALVARDGQGLLVQVTLNPVDRAERNADIDALSERLHQLTDELRAAGDPDAQVLVGGGPVLNRTVNAVVQQDVTRAEAVSLPITLLVLILVFGGLVAAALPVLSAAMAVAGSMIVLLGFTLAVDVDQNALTVTTLLGLGLSIDYGLLLVARYREELAGGFTPEEAVGRAWATAGRTILFSALTVAAALSGLLMFDVPQLRALGAAGLTIALVAMVTALTFTAALLGLTRRWIKPSSGRWRFRFRRASAPAGPAPATGPASATGTAPASGPASASGATPAGGAAPASGAAPAGVGDESESGFFARLSRMVQRRAVLVALVTAALLLVAGAPLLQATIKLPQLEQIPDSIEAKRVATALGERFGQSQSPAVIVVARTSAAGLDAWAARWSGDQAVERVEPAQAVGTDLARVNLAVTGDSQSTAAQDLVDRVRADRPPGGESWVTGDAAVLRDLLQLLGAGLPLALGTTLVAMILLLFAMTGSLVVPIKAILANVISLGATFGVMVAVFEKGFGGSVLDTLTTGGLDPFIVVIVFAFAFGLSMDYEVFLLSRIIEYTRRGVDTDTAVRRGLQHTGRVITSAALLMVVVFACFGAARIGSVEQVGLGLTVAVLIDATIVRCLLVPATMTLLGRWNWWAPAPLKRLHTRFGLREAPLPDAPAREPELATTPR